MIRVFAVSFSEEFARSRAEQYAFLAPEPARSRLARLKSPERRAERVFGYALLRYGAERAFGFCPGRLEYGPYGKPFFPGAPQMQFSISHTRGAALCALGETPLGADIERMRPVRPALVRRLLGGEPALNAEGIPEAFFREWVLRESRLKRVGIGFARGLSPKDGGESGRLYWDVEGCAAAVCASPGGTLPSGMEQVEPEKLLP